MDDQRVTEQSVTDTYRLPSFLVILVVVSAILSVASLIVSILAFGNKTSLDKGELESGTIEELVPSEQVERGVVDHTNNRTEQTRADGAAIERILQANPRPEFRQNGYDVEIVDPVSGESAVITSEIGMGVRVFGVPDPFDGRIIVLYFGETEHRFQPYVIDLNNPTDLVPQKVDRFFPSYEPLHVLSPNGRYLLSIIDEVWSGDKMNTFNITDLLSEYRAVMMNDSMDVRITATDYDWLNYEVPEFDIRWTSDLCVEYTLYENGAAVPRPVVRTETYCYSETP